MATKIVLNMYGDEGDTGSTSHLVRETFDQVLDRVQPLNTPPSQLENRHRFCYESVDGNRIWIPPSHVWYFIENAEEK